MKTGTIVGLGVIGSIGGAVVLATVSYISAANLGNRSEAGIKATWENNENILAQYGQKVQEAAQVPGMMTDDLRKVFTESNASRYGASGSTATMQWIKEQNPNLSPDLYIQIQRIIESGRNEFQQNQTRLVDQKRTYETNLGSVYTGFWLGVAG